MSVRGAILIPAMSLLTVTVLVERVAAVDQSPDLERAVREFMLGHYTQAADLFEKAFERDKRPALLFKAARAHQQAGNQARAVDLYKSYLRLVPAGERDPEALHLFPELTSLVCARAGAPKPETPSSPLAVEIPGPTVRLRPFPANGKYGFVGRGGEFVIRPRYDEAEEFSDGLAAVGMRTGVLIPDLTRSAQCRVPEVQWTFIDSTGKAVFSAGTSGKAPGPWSEGRARVWCGGLVGYVDVRGEPVIPPRFDDASPFSNGLAAVKVRDLWGYIDRNGRTAIEPRYSWARDFSDGIASVQTHQGEDQLIDAGGHVLTDKRISQLRRSEGMSGLCVGSLRAPRCGYYRAGKVAIPLQFEDALPFSEGLAPVKTQGKWGFIDDHGTFVIAPQFDQVISGMSDRGSGFHGGFAAVLLPGRWGKWGFIDRKGNLAVPAEFDEVGAFSEGLVPVRKGKRWGYADRSGKVIGKVAFDKADEFHDGLGRVTLQTSDGDRVGFVDRTGNIAIPVTFGRAEPFENGYSEVYDPVFFRSRLIDVRGRTTLVPKYPNFTQEGCPADILAPPHDYNMSVRIESDPPGAQVYLVPLWDWESSDDGRALLADPAKLDVYRVPNGLTAVTTVVRRQVYMAVFQLAGKHVVRKLTPTKEDSQFRVTLK